MQFRRRVVKWFLKSLHDLYPELLNREHLTRINSDEEAQNPATFQGYASDYNITCWVHTAVKKWQDAFASLPLHIVAGKEVLPNHELVQFFQNPNSQRSAADIWRQWACDMALGGAEGFEFARARGGKKQIVEIWPHQPCNFGVIPDEDRRVYYGVAGYSVQRPGSLSYELSPADFLHMKFYNPVNPWIGISPMSAIRMSVAIEQLSSAWVKMFFTNGARPDGIVLAPQGLTKPELDEIERKFHEKLGLSERGIGWHRVIALEQGVADYKPVNFSQKDMQWAESRGFTRNEIGGIFGVPDEMMGFGKDTYENFERALLTFYSETIVPLARLRDDSLTFFFRREGRLKMTESVQTDFTGIGVLAKLQSPVYFLAEALSRMGVPFKVINEFLKMGVPDFAASTISNPFGTADSFDEEGETIDEKALRKILSRINDRLKSNGVMS